MAKCSGCTSTGCNCSLTPGTNVTITGDGSDLLPYIISASGGGGGDCAQKNIYTVATIGLQGLGFDLGTQEPFRSCADFIGDGVNDEVAINAACTAAVGTLLVDIYPEVYLNSGVFVTSAAINAQKTSLRGSLGGSALGARTIITNAAAASGFPLLIDPACIIDMAVGNLLAGNNETTVQINSIMNVIFERARITNSALGPGSGTIEFNNVGDVTIRDCAIGGNGGGVAAIPGVYFNPATTGGIIKIIGNNFSVCTIDLNNMYQGSQIKDNFISLPGGGTIAANRGAINLVHPGTNVILSNWQVSGNNIANIAGHGIYIDGGSNPSGSFAWSQVHNNLIYGYGGSGTNQFDGIILVGNVDETSIQGNKCFAFAGGGARHGINISAATCNDNFVTNNDLFSSGAGTSINDAGTGTITAAGNRL